MKSPLYALFAALAGVTSLPANADSASGVITFQGAVNDTTCTINGHNTSSLTVALPPISVDQANLLGRNGLIPVNRQPFQLDLSDCTQAGVKEGWMPTIKMSFSGAQISDDGKFLKNEVAGKNGLPNNVGIAITEQDNPDHLIALNSPYDTGLTQESTVKGPQSLKFYANYYKQGTGEASAGAVRTLVTYALSYN